VEREHTRKELRKNAALHWAATQWREATWWVALRGSVGQEAKISHESHMPPILSFIQGKIDSLATKVCQICKIPLKFLRSENYHQKLQVSLKNVILFVLLLTRITETKMPLLISAWIVALPHF
jgi:hypothetical protein